MPSFVQLEFWKRIALVNHADGTWEVQVFAEGVFVKSHGRGSEAWAKELANRIAMNAEPAPSAERSGGT